MAYNFTDRRLLKTPMSDAKLGPFDKSKGKKPTVATPSLSYQRMRHWWDVVDVLRGGTSKIREMGEAYLPKEPGEGKDAYSRRLSRVVLTPWYQRLVRGLVGMVLRKPIKLDSESVTDRTKELLDLHLEDVNLQGDNLQTFAKDIFESAIDYNYCGILVEYPDTSNLETLADEIAAEVRPYWQMFPAQDILGMRWQQFGSQRILTQVRLRQTVTEDDGEWGEVEIEQILAYSLEQAVEGDRVIWQIYREEERKGESEWILYKDGLLSIDRIPFAVCYTDKKCRLELPPPMIEVAFLNLKHYQLSEDLDHALHVAAKARMFIFGASPEDVGDIDSIDEAICIPNPEARVEWISAKIDSFAPLQSRITEVEQQMAVLGLATLATQKNVGESAEAKRLDRTQGDSIMAVIAQSLQNALNMAVYYHLQFLNIAEEASVQVSRDFDLSQMDPAMISALYQIRQGGDLSQETFLQLLKQGEIGLPDDFDIDAEIQKLEEKAKQEMQAQPIDLRDFMPGNPATVVNRGNAVPSGIDNNVNN